MIHIWVLLSPYTVLVMRQTSSTPIDDYIFGIGQQTLSSLVLCLCTEDMGKTRE